jgi:hypothetical protein
MVVDITTVLRLNKKLSTMSSKDKRFFLLNCIDNSNFNIPKLKKETSEILQNFDDLCPQCKNSNFIKNKYEEICNTCGYVRPFQDFQKSFEKSDLLIGPNNNNIKLIINGKTIIKNLNLINLWLQDIDYFAIETRELINIFDKIKQTKYYRDDNNIIQNTMLNLWYNFNQINTKKLNKTEKKAIMALCIYYAFSIHKAPVSEIQLINIFQDESNKLTLSIFNKINSYFKIIFKDTNFDKFINIYTEIDIIPNYQTKKEEILYNKIYDHIKISFKLNEIDNSYKAAILYYLQHKFNLPIKNTYDKLSKDFKISIPVIRSKVNQIENYYRANQQYYKELLI